MVSSRSLRWFPILFVLGGACGDDDGDRDARTDVPADAADADADAVDAGEDAATETPDGIDPADGDEEADETPPPPCVEPTAECFDGTCPAPGPDDRLCLGGTVTEPDGSPIPDQSVVVCASGRCYFGRANDAGWFAVRVPIAGAAEAALYFPSAEPRFSPFCHYDGLCSGPVHLCDEFALYPAPTPTVTFPEGALPADVRLEADDGAAIVFAAGDELLFQPGMGPGLGFTRFPLDDHVPCFLDPENLPIALYAAWPYDVFVIEPGTLVDPVLRSAALDLPNDTGLAAGTELAVFVLGGAHGVEAEMAEAEWREWTTATVTADGTRIRTAPGAGLGYLTWFALYPR